MSKDRSAKLIFICDLNTRRMIEDMAEYEETTKTELFRQMVWNAYYSYVQDNLLPALDIDLETYKALKHTCYVSKPEEKEAE